jgi:guanine deaminase
MEMAGALMREHPDLHMQTHLSENRAEIELACSLYPEAKDYTDIYARYGLLGQKALIGHCIHLSEREADALSETGSVAVFCPTSNLFLGSGLFDWQRYRKRDKPLRVAAATDVGGGTNYSMLRTMDEGYKVIALQGEKIDPLSSFWQITRGNAEALSLAHRIGTLEPGTDADLVVLNSVRHAQHGAAHGAHRDAGRGTVHAADAGRRPRGGGDLCRGQGRRRRGWG